MKAAAIWLPLCFGCAVGCGDGGPTPPDGSGSRIRITITTEPAPVLVVFRDGVAAPWQTATMQTPTTFEAEVQGPYLVTIVCDDPATGEAATFQLARTPIDDHDLVQPCNFVRAPRFTVAGHMVQAGRIQIATSTQTSTAADWDFTLEARGGTYDLLAATFAGRMVLRRGMAITANTAVTPAIDAVQDGVLLADAAFTVTNAAPNELLGAVVGLDTLNATASLSVYRGSIGTAKVAPDSALTAADTQTASIQGTVGNATRSLRRPFRVGGNATFTLPAPLTGVQWEIANGNLGATWSSVPSFDALSASTNTGTAGAPLRRHVLNMSPSFFGETSTTRAIVNTDIPGYQPTWRVDYTQPYYRQLLVRRTTGDELASSSVSDFILSP